MKVNINMLKYIWIGKVDKMRELCWFLDFGPGAIEPSEPLSSRQLKKNIKFDKSPGALPPTCIYFYNNNVIVFVFFSATDIEI